jgi:hypothetical protein
MVFERVWEVVKLECEKWEIVHGLVLGWVLVALPEELLLLLTWHLNVQCINPLAKYVPLLLLWVAL